MRRSSASAIALAVATLVGGAVTGSSSALAHGNEAAFHDVQGAQAPTLEVTASTEGTHIRIQLQTTHFTWADSTSVANFTSGEGAARIYLDTNKAMRAFSPDVTLDSRAWNLAPGEHTVTVTLTGSDLVPYAANGEEVEVTVPIIVNAPASEVARIEVPSGSSFSVSGARDPFGGWIFTPHLEGFEGTQARLEFAIDGRPWAESSGESIHVYPDAIVGKDWLESSPLPLITVSAVDASAGRFTAGGVPAQIAFAAPTSTDVATWSWTSQASHTALWWISAAVALVGIVAIWALRRHRRHRSH